MYRYYTETRGDIFMPRGEAEGQKYINPSFGVIPDIHTTGEVFSYFTVHSSEYSNHTAPWCVQGNIILGYMAKYNIGILIYECLINY